MPRSCCCGYLGLLWLLYAKYGDSRRSTPLDGIFTALCLTGKSRRATSYAIFLGYRFCSLNVLKNLRFGLFPVTFLAET